MKRLAILDALALAVLVVIAAAAWMLRPDLVGGWGFDAFAYWSVDPANPYTHTLGAHGAFLYSPAVAQAAALLGRLPWEAFLVVWTALLAAALYAMAVPRAALSFLVPVVTLEMGTGNIHLLLALAVVAGFRWPAAWAFVLLTKVTPGVGLAWFVARRDWRSLAIATSGTLAVITVSLLLAPDLWRQWIELLAAAPSQTGETFLGSVLGPLWVRLPVAVGIAAVAGLAGLRWPLAVSLFLAIPSLWLVSASCLVALVPLVRMDRRDPLPARWPSFGRVAHPHAGVVAGRRARP